MMYGVKTMGRHMAGAGRVQGCIAAALVAVVLGVLAPAHASPTIVEAWGDGTFGTLGNGANVSSSVPVAVSNLSGNVSAVSGGGSASLAIQGGGAYTWGNNASGQLGNGTTTNTNLPQLVGGLSTGVSAVAGGGNDSLALQNGVVYLWGDGSTAPAAVGGLPAGVTTIASGTFHHLAIQGGAAYAWGANSFGQLGNGTTTDSAIAVAVSGLTTGVTAIAGGAQQSFAIKNGGLYSWGFNQLGELGNGTTTNSSIPMAVPGLSTGVTAIAAGWDQGLAIQGGYVYTWGLNDVGELGDGTNNNFKSTPELIDPADLHDIIAVASENRSDSSYALSSDGTIWDWGMNNLGQLGLGTTTTDYLTPQHLLPPVGYEFTAISANQNGAVAILTVVPEPASLSLIALTATALLRRRSRR